MTYPELLTSLYREHTELLALWQQAVRESGESGALAFLPDAYLSGAGLRDIRFEFWPGSELRTYLIANGCTDEGYRELEEQIDRAREFVVLIIEPADADGKRPVHIHRIGPVGHN